MSLFLYLKFERFDRLRRLHFRPELLLSKSLDSFSKFQKFISDDSDYEAQFAYGKEIFDDFNYNVGRKMHIIKSTIKVWTLIFTITINQYKSTGVVLSHWFC